jgi:hypothetical protein
VGPLCVAQPFSLVSVSGNEGVYCGDYGSSECGIAWQLKLTPLGGRSGNYSLDTVVFSTDLYDDLLSALPSVSGYAMCVQQLVPSVRVYVSLGNGGYLSWRFRFAQGNCSNYHQPTGYTLYGTLPDGTALAPISSSNFTGLLVPCGSVQTPSSTSSAEQPSANCGNGILEGNEQCDPPGPCCSAFCEWLPAGTTCDDGDSCTTDDICAGASACMGTPLDCNDGQPCTRDSCSAGRCVNEWQIKQRGCRAGPPPVAPECASNCSITALADYCGLSVGAAGGPSSGDGRVPPIWIVLVVVLCVALAVALMILAIVVFKYTSLAASLWSAVPSFGRGGASGGITERVIYQAPNASVPAASVILPSHPDAGSVKEAVSDFIHDSINKVTNSFAQERQRREDYAHEQQQLWLESEKKRLQSLSAAAAAAPVPLHTLGSAQPTPFELQKNAFELQQRHQLAQQQAQQQQQAAALKAAQQQQALAQQQVYESQQRQLELQRQQQQQLQRYPTQDIQAKLSAAISMPPGWPSGAHPSAATPFSVTMPGFQYEE